MIKYSAYDTNGNYVAGGSCSPDSIASIIASYERQGQGWTVSFRG